MPRFFRSPRWHLVVTDQSSATVTLLDRLATSRSVRYELGSPAQFQALVPSDSPEINIPHTDGFTTSQEFPVENYPFLAEGVRFLYGLRRDVMIPGSDFEPRFAGLILDLEDAGDTGRGLSRFTAYDPWQYLQARPCLNKRVPFGGGEAFDLPGDMGTVFLAGARLDFVALELLRRTIATDGSVFIDAGDGSRIGEGAQYDDWGGTSDYAGTIEQCATLSQNMMFQKGMSVGEAWSQLVDTGGIDIVLKPIYDPTNRPGYLCEFNCYVPEDFNYGQTPEIPNFVPQICWDRTGHAVTRISRSTDGKERANKIRVFGPKGAPRPTLTSTPSIERFGRYWSEFQVDRYGNNQTLDGMADRELRRREKGRRVWSLDLAPEWEIIPFRDLDLGYDIGLYHSNRLREESWEFHRVLGFGLEIADTAGEQITDVTLSTDDEFIVSP